MNEITMPEHDKRTLTAILTYERELAQEVTSALPLWKRSPSSSINGFISYHRNTELARRALLEAGDKLAEAVTYECLCGENQDTGEYEQCGGCCNLGLALTNYRAAQRAFYEAAAKEMED